MMWRDGVYVHPWDARRHIRGDPRAARCRALGTEISREVERPDRQGERMIVYRPGVYDTLQ